MKKNLLFWGGVGGRGIKDHLEKFLSRSVLHVHPLYGGVSAKGPPLWEQGMLRSSYTIKPQDLRAERDPGRKSNLPVAKLKLQAISEIQVW